MTNEIFFITHIIWISITVLGALFIGKEALIALIALFTILANLFVTKQINLFGFHVTTTDAFTIGSVLGMNILQEYYGNHIARKTIIIGFCTALFFTFSSILHLSYLPNNFDTLHAHFVPLLTPMPRIIAASLCSYLLSQYLDYFLFNLLKKRFPQKTISFRYGFSTAISQFFDTILFSFLGLYGIVHSLVDLIFISYCIKLAAIALSIPFAWLSGKILQGRIT